MTMSYEVNDSDEETNRSYRMRQINKSILDILFLWKIEGGGWQKCSVGNKIVST